MPKVVDHAVRRRELAEALWRVVADEGVEAVSVRSVAAAAGWSPSALRHYFPDQRELVGAAMKLVIERIAARIASLAPSGSPLDRSLLYFEQLLPMDADRRMEKDVWFGFVTRARLDPGLAGITADVHRDLRGFVEGILRQLPVPDPEAAALRLLALIDGLSIHMLLHPDEIGPAYARLQLAAHLAEITRE